MKKYIKNKKGITLIELMVSMSIFAIVMTVTVSFFITIQKMQMIYRDRVNLHQEVRIASEILARYIREAESINFTENSDICTGSTFTANMKDGMSLIFSCSGSGSNQLKMNGSDITSSNIHVSNVTFYRGSEPTYPKTLRYNIEVKQTPSSTSEGEIINFPSYLVMRNEL